MEVHFHIGMIKANGVSGSSALNVGTTVLVGFCSNSKSVQGSGSNSGDHGAFPTLLNALDDRDLVDTPIFGAGLCGPATQPPFLSWPHRG